MRYYIYRLEITDGEHQYYSSGLCVSGTGDIDSAIDCANEAARDWYEDDRRQNITDEGKDYQVWEHQCGTIICAVDQVEEIPAEDYLILTKYPSYI